VPFTNNQSFNLIFDNFVFSQSTCVLNLYYPTIELDALSAAASPSQGVVCGSVSQNFTTYTIIEDGKYAFSASKIFKWDTPAQTTAIVDRELFIVVYSDNTLTTIERSWAKTESGVVIPPNGNPLNPLYYVDSMSVETPVWDLQDGWVVVVGFYYIVTLGTTLSISIVDGVFEYDAEKLRCEQIINPSDNTLPYRYSFNKSLCNSEFEDLDANKEDIIKLQGEDTYISEVTQDIKGGASFVLISNTPFTKCEQS
jgi:hypothetical protein